MIPEVSALHDADAPDAGAGRNNGSRLSCCTQPKLMTTATFQLQIKFWEHPFILCVRSFFLSVTMKVSELRNL